jgi:beta-galactosidase
MGLLVFNELFDSWDASADLHDPSQFEPFMRRNVRNFVARDRNHPCVIVWSIGNEIEDVQRPKPHGENERKVAFMVGLFKQHDPTRPVTMACHRPGVLESEILDTLDVQSWNYTRKYAAAKKRYPDKPTIYSESAAALSTRGFYSLPQPAKREDYVDAAARQISSYDLNAQWWSDIADVEFARMDEDRFCAGSLSGRASTTWASRFRSTTNGHVKTMGAGPHAPRAAAISASSICVAFLRIGIICTAATGRRKS